MPVLPCLENIIGLSETNCPCYGSDEPNDHAVSNSGLFLDRLEGIELNMVNAASDCASGGIWDRMRRSVSEATIRFQADLLAALQVDYVLRRKPFTGFVGEQNANQTMLNPKQFQGLRLWPIGVIGGYMTVKKIGVIMNQSGPVTINVHDNINFADASNPMESVTIQAVANKMVYGVLPNGGLKLPLWDAFGRFLYYFFIYDRSAGFTPKRNLFGCYTCMAATNMNNFYKEWIIPHGVSDSNFDNIIAQNGGLFVDTACGLSINAEFKCATDELICNEWQTLDFSGNGIHMQMATAIRLKAGEILLNDLLNSTNINIFTLMRREILEDYRKQYKTTYDQWILYLKENTNVDFNHCLKCKPDRGMYKTGTLL